MAHQMVGSAVHDSSGLTAGGAERDLATLMRGCDRPDERPGPSCPLEITLAVLRGRWSPLVLRELFRGDRGYSELAAALPALSDKVLSDRLAQLTSQGVVERDRTPGWPARVTYRLTERGRALGPVLEAMWAWGAG